MNDHFANYSESLNSPPSNIFAVAPDDAQDLPHVTRALNVGQSGTIRVTTARGTTEVLTVAAGIVFPIRASRIWATDTTATNIVAMF